MQKSEFRNPAPRFRAATLWMLNDRLEVEELRRQLREIHDKGIGAVIPRTFMGLRTEYLSEEWMRATEAIVELAGELDVKVFFQAGYMPGAIPDQDPNSAHVAIACIPRHREPGEGQVTVAEDETFRYVRERRIHVLNMFDPGVVTNYLEDAYERTWFGRFGNEFGSTIASVWVDEPHFNPPHLPWGEALKERFEEDWGYRIETHVPALFVATGEHERIRHHYWRTVTGLLLDPELSPAPPPPPAPVRETVVEIDSWSLRPHAPNALTLDYARLKRGDGEFSDLLPVIAMQKILQEEPYEGPITLRCEFEVEKPPTRLAVAVEDADRFDITINGREVAYAGMDYYVDRSFLPVDLTTHVRARANTMESRTEFQPLDQPEFMLNRLFANVPGTEIESVYLIGDFAVRGQLSSKPQREESVRYAPGFVLTSEPATSPSVWATTRRTWCGSQIRSGSNRRSPRRAERPDPRMTKPAPGWNVQDRTHNFVVHILVHFVVELPSRRRAAPAAVRREGAAHGARGPSPRPSATRRPAHLPCR
jgi:hypothetical protein